jgi:sugar phosphate permease
MTFARYRWSVFGVLALGYITVMFHRLCPAVVAVDLIRDFNATGALIGMMAGAYFYPYALMQIPSGLLADSLGPRRTVTLSLALAALGSVIFSLAATPSMAIASRVVVGFGASMLFVSTLKIVSQWFTKKEFAMMSGLMNAAGGLGALTAAAPLAILTAWVGWRADFAIIGGITFLVVGLIWWIVRDRPQDKGWPAVEAELESASARASLPALGRDLRRVVTRGHIWPLAGWFFLQGGVFFGVGGLWGGPYLMHVYGMTRQEAGQVLNMISVGMIIGSPLMAWLSNQIFHSRKRVLVTFSAVFVAVVGVLAWQPAGLPLAALYLLFFLFAVCGSGTVPVGFAAAKEIFPLGMAGVVLGFTNMFPLGGGAVFQPMLGALMDQWPRDPSGLYPIEAFSAMWRVCFVASLGMLLCALLSRKETNS